jgi:geranylgeranyl diphosphate synthase, type II
MQILGSMKNRIGEEIAHIQFGTQPPELYDPLYYLMALLTTLGCFAFSDQWEKSIPLAVASEVFHNFTLMHDDLMDNAPLRRNRATVHEKWNPNVAILSGDVMLVEAYRLLEKLEAAHFQFIFPLFNRCAAEVCEGQQMDMNFQNRDQVTEADYLEMIRLKTSVLLGFCLQAGAIVGGAAAKDADRMRHIGVNMGIVFQLHDDYLDVYANPEEFGKQTGGDIVENKKTFLLIKALETAQEKDKKELLYWIGLKKFDAAEKIQAVRGIYDRNEIPKLSEEKAAFYFQQAMNDLQELGIEAEKKEGLRLFLTQILERQK